MVAKVIAKSMNDTFLAYSDLIMEMTGLVTMAANSELDMVSSRAILEVARKHEQRMRVILETMKSGIESAKKEFE